MKGAKMVMLLGILVALVPYLGFPSSWKALLCACFGLSIAVIAYRSVATDELREQEPNESDTQNIDSMTSQPSLTEETTAKFATHE